MAAIETTLAYPGTVRLTTPYLRRWTLFYQTPQVDTCLLYWLPGRPTRFEPQALTLDAELPGLVQQLMAYLKQRLPKACLQEQVGAYAAISLVFNTQQQPFSHCLHRLKQALAQWQPDTHSHAKAQGRLIRIPVCYDPAFAWDLAAVAQHTGLSPEALVAAHTQAVYQVHAVGFSPGFAYMGTVPASLQVPRHPQPRQSVPAGSVAIAAQQTAIYPIETAAGWHIIGRTPLDLSLQDPANLTRFRVGDRVQFEPISQTSFHQWQGASDAHSNTDSAETTMTTAPALSKRPAFQLEHHRFPITIQDGGRTGYQHAGLAPSGAIDRWGAFQANACLGQPIDWPVLEIALGQCTLVSTGACHIALAGADMACRHNQRPVARYRAISIQPGDRLCFDMARTGRYGYVAIQGGWDSPVFYGSRSVNQREGLGQALQSQTDLFQLNPARQNNQNSLSPCQQPTESVTRSATRSAWLPSQLLQPTLSKHTPVVLRFVPGFQWSAMSANAQALFCQTLFEVDANSNRIATRLSPLTQADALTDAMGAFNLISEPLCDGAIQIPPSGTPIVMQADRPTMGGYPKPGALWRPDLYKLAQLPPNQRVRFVPMRFDLAQRQWAQWQGFWSKTP